MENRFIFVPGSFNRVLKGWSMYVHIGGEYTLLMNSIVAILDMEKITHKQKNMMRFLTETEKSDKAEYVSDEIPRSIIVTRERIYFSPISVLVLQKRMAETL